MSSKVFAVYSIHVIVVLATVYITSQSGLVSTWLIALIAAPLGLSFTARYEYLSYNINVRILFPLSVGLFFVFLYDYIPQIIDFSDQSQLSRIGVSNLNDSIPSDFFNVNPVFIDSVSVLYAICAAFLLWKGLTDFDDLKHTLYDEAHQVRSIADFASYFSLSGKPDENAPCVFRLHQLLLAYLENILEGSRVIVKKENENVIQECVVTVSKLKVGDSNDQIALEEVMKGVANLSALRSRRMVCIEKKMSPYILFLMGLMSLTMVLSFFGKISTGVSFEYAYVFLLPVFYTSIFMTLLDLSSPFDGYWSIKLHALTETITWLRENVASDNSSKLK